MGDASALGSAGDTEAAKRAAEQIADYLAPLGFNLDFAPVADVVNPLRSDTMGLRSFSSDAAVAADMVRAEVEGFRDNRLERRDRRFRRGVVVGDGAHGKRVGDDDARVTQGTAGFAAPSHPDRGQARAPLRRWFPDADEAVLLPLARAVPTCRLRQPWNRGLQCGALVPFRGEPEAEAGFAPAAFHRLHGRGQNAGVGDLAGGGIQVSELVVGAALGEPQLLDEGDVNWEMPTLAVAGGYAFWQRLPQLDGNARGNGVVAAPDERAEGQLRRAGQRDGVLIVFHLFQVGLRGDGVFSLHVRLQFLGCQSFIALTCDFIS